MEFNLISNPDKYAAVAEAMDVRVDGMNRMEAARSAVTAVRELIADVGLPGRLRDINVAEEDFAKFADPVVHNFPRITSNNPRQCTEKDIVAIYRAAY
jgi:alcohol dehydrogenase class IV